MKDIVIFGLGKVAEVATYYMTQESDTPIAGFTCDAAFVDRDEFAGKRVVAFDGVEKTFPPERCAMFVALGYQNLNKLRADRVAQARAKGYDIFTFVHPQSGLPKDATVGENCFILNQVQVQPRVTIGNNVFVWSGALIGHHSTIGDDCWITSSVNIAGSVVVGRRCFFGINATVANEVTIGDDCFIGASALVTKPLKDGQVVIQPSSDVQRVTSEQFLRFARLK